jgi:Holliday junction resolvase YEN1
MLKIGRLWDTIRNFENTTPIAQFAQEHFERHGKPFRIAVDEPDWRFNNVTRQQVFAIRESTYIYIPVVCQS